MGSRYNTFKKNISPSNKEMIIIQAEKLKESEDVINLKFEITPNRHINFLDIKNSIYYEIYSNNILY